MDNSNKPRHFSTRQRTQALNRIFQAGVEKANQLDVDEEKLVWTPIKVPQDYESIQTGINHAGYYIEQGARTFSAYAKAMINDLGEDVIPYLKSWYMAIKYSPQAAGFEGMDSMVIVERYDVDSLRETNNGSQSLDVDIPNNIWIPAGVCLSIQKALMIQTSMTWQEMTADNVQTMMQGKIHRLLRQAQEDGLPIQDLLEQVPGVTEVMLMEQDLMQMAGQIAMTETIEMITNLPDYSRKAPLNPTASKMLRDQDLQTWVEDVLTALEEM